MYTVDLKKRADCWRLLLAKKDTKALLRVLREAPMVEVAEFLSEQPLTTLVSLFRLFETKKQATLFEHFCIEDQLKIFEEFFDESLVEMLEQVSSDLRVDFYLQLNKSQQAELLSSLSEAACKSIRDLSVYGSEKAGGIMSTDFVSVNHNITVTEALAQIREVAPSKKMMYFLYVVDDQMKLLGIIDLKDLLLAMPEVNVMTLAKLTVVYGEVQDDREIIVNKIEKYGLMALPILDAEKRLVGIVDQEEAIEVIREEETEDMERFMGIVSDDTRESYLHTSSTQHFKQRVWWVTALYLIGAIACFVIHSFDDALKTWHMLAIYIPMISDTGGNVGSQAASMVIRALSLKQVTLKNWLTIIYKEGKVALMLALWLFVLSIVKVGLLTFYGTGTEEISLWCVTLTISFAISVQVLTATLIGASLPLLIKRLGKDPVLAASPAITTIVDITGLLIYFLSATFFFSHSFPF